MNDNIKCLNQFHPHPPTIHMYVYIIISYIRRSNFELLIEVLGHSQCVQRQDLRTISHGVEDLAERRKGSIPCSGRQMSTPLLASS